MTTGGGSLRPADLELHARLGIPPELLAAVASRVNDREARDQLGVKHTGDLAGVLYARLDPETGGARGYRLRRDHPEVEHGRPINKYLSSCDKPAFFFAPDVAPLLLDLSVSVVLVEAEKSALTVTASAIRSSRRVLAIGMGGCWGWRGRIGKTTDATGARVDVKGSLPDLDRLAWPDRAVVLMFDANAATNPKVQAARRALASELIGRGAQVRIADLPVEDGVNGPDDFYARHGDVALWAIVDGARPIQPENAADVLRLAALDNLHGVTLDDLEGRLRRLRDALQGADAIRRRTVRELVIAALKVEKISGAAALVDAAIGGVDDDLSSPAVAFLADDEPWPDPVDGAALLDALSDAITRYVVVPRQAVLALVLWIVLTYFDAVVNLLPLLLITSPTKRCGKTKTVEIVSGLVCRALPASNISAAALYRAIDKFHPTLLLDEADTFIGDDLELRGVINAGHTRHTARVIRCVGDDSEPTIFSTWCPKAIAMIGLPKDTLIDRSIVVRLERKAPGDTVTRLRADHVHQVFSELRRRIRRWADDHQDAMRVSDPKMPGGLHDRAEDNCRPLIAIADLAGGSWPKDARDAVLALAGSDGDDEPIGEALLADLRAIYEDTTTVPDRREPDCLTTAHATELLVGLDSKPWATYNTKSGKPISQHQLARLLKRFGVKPKKEWIARIQKSENCYRRDDLESAWNRYSPSTQVGRSEESNKDGPESTVSSRNGSQAPSDPKTAVSPIKTAVLPTFRPDDPVKRERGEV